MVAAATTLPSLPTPDEAVLTRLFETDALSLADLFKSLTQNPINGAPQTLLDLCRWSQRDDIRPWLDFHASELSAAIRRRRIAKLEQIADTSKDLVEQRHACTTALRALDAIRRVGRASGSPSSPDRGVRTPIPHTLIASSEPRPSGSGTLEPPAAPNNVQSPRFHSAPIPPDPAHPDTPVPPSPNFPLPTPNSPPSPDSLLELVISHIQTPRDPASIAALAGALVPRATINNTPVDGLAPQISLAALPIPPSTLTAIDPALIESTDDTITWSSTLTYATGDRTRFRLELTRANDLWQISSLDHYLDTT